MRKVSGYLTDNGRFFQTEQECIADELVDAVLGGYLRNGDKSLVDEVTKRYEIRRKDGT